MERKVLSIVAEIRKRQLARARDEAERSRLREALAAVEAAEVMQQLDDLDFDEALAQLASVDDPEAVEAAAALRCARALRACAHGDAESGLAEWAAVIAEYPTLSFPFIARGRYWLQQREDPDRAMPDFERAVAVDPASGDAYRWRARCFEVQGDIERALANYRRAAALDPDGVDLQHAVAIAFTEHEVHDEALAAWARLVTLEPKYFDFWTGLARERGATGDHDGEIEALERALEVAFEGGEFAEEREQFAKLVAQRHVQRALAHAREDRPQEAFEEASRAIELDPTFAKAWTIRGVYRTALDHEPALVMADMDRGVELAPDDPAAHFQRAAALRWMDDMRGALVECGKAIALAPRVGQLYYERAEWRQEADHPDDAHELMLADYDLALENGHREADCFVKKADTLAALGRLPESIATLDVAASEHPDDGWIFVWRAEYKRRLGDAEGARADDAIGASLGEPSLVRPPE